MRAANTRKAFRRTPVQPDVMQQPRMVTIPAAIRGLVVNENPAFMEPGGATVLDNIFPTQRGLRLRGGCKEWCDTGSGKPIISSFNYVVGWTLKIFFGTEDVLWDGTFSGAAVNVHAGQNSGNYCASQMSNQGGDWMLVVNEAGDYPLRFNGTTWEIMNAAYTPGGGLPSKITGPPGSDVEDGSGLTYVWTYRNRYYFIEGGTMNLWYLGLNSPGGLLALIPLGGAASKGGSLLFGACWSIDAGDGTDDKNIVVTTLGEVIVFTGSDPSDASNWRQEGRYSISPPLGMNAHIQVGGDILIATVDGVVPVSACINKERAALELAAVTRTIERLWETEVMAKRDWPWMMHKWDERSILFVATPGGEEDEWRVLVANVSTGAWCRFTGWDATTFVGLQGNCYFGTQDGRVMQAWMGGNDDGRSYLCRYVGGWEHFGNRSALVVWRQARCSFASEANEPFHPQLTATVDYQVKCPTPPSAGPDPGLHDVWDQAFWGEDTGIHNALPWQNAHLYDVVGAKAYGTTGGIWAVAVAHTSAPLGTTFAQDRANNPTHWTLVTPTAGERTSYGQWDQQAPVFPPPIRNTLWVSIGETGYTHAPIVQVMVSQQITPQVGIISIDAVVEICGTAV